MKDISETRRSLCRFYLTIILIALTVLSTHAQKDIHPYESASDACSKCGCTEKENKPPAKYYVLYCRSKNFTQILADYPTNFDLSDTATQMELSFSGNNITFLNQLPPTEVLVHFSCSHCGIKEISSEVFIDVPSIYRVDLSWNELNDLLPDVFRGRYNPTVDSIGLVELDLSYNLFEILEHGIFEHVKGLKVLNLEHNPINLEHPSTVAALASLKNVEKLNLAFTGIDTLPADVLKSDRLIELNIYGNKFSTIPDSLSIAGGSLKWLNVGGNPIVIINEGNFSAMNSLKLLDISDMDSLEFIHPNAFSQLTAIETFFCRNNSNLTSIDIGSISFTTLRKLDISNCSLVTLEITCNSTDHPDHNDTAPLLFSNLQTLKIDNNPWHCNCSLFKSLQKLMRFDENDFQSEHTARCSTPYELTSDLLVDITIDKLCMVSNNKKPRQPVYDPPPFLRPRSILFSLLSILMVILIGLCIGFAIVLIKKKLKQNEVGFSSPIRYTTVRNSTISVG